MKLKTKCSKENKESQKIVHFHRYHPCVPNQDYFVQYLLEEAQLAEELGSETESQTSNCGVTEFFLTIFFLSEGCITLFACSSIAFTVCLKLQMH